MADQNIDMFDDEFDLDDDGDLYEEPAQPTNLVRKLRRELNAAKKALKEKDSALSSLMSDVRTRTIKDVLASNGANPKIAAFVPADIEPNEQAVSSWLNEYGDVFGFRPAESADDRPSSSVNSDAVGRMNAAEAFGSPVEVAGDLENMILNASSREELQALLRNA